VDDKELILKVRAGQREAFNELVSRYQKRIFQVVYRLLRNYEDAEEISQDVFVLAYQAIKGFRLRSSFYTWIYRIAINLCYHRLRSRQHKVKLKTTSLQRPIETKKPNPYQALASKEQLETIYRAMASLKRKFYQVLVLHDLESLSYKEISQIQNCSLGTVMSRLHRARLQLAKKIKNLGIVLP